MSHSTKPLDLEVPNIFFSCLIYPNFHCKRKEKSLFFCAECSTKIFIQTSVRYIYTIYMFYIYINQPRVNVLRSAANLFDLVLSSVSKVVTHQSSLTHLPFLSLFVALTHSSVFLCLFCSLTLTRLPFISIAYRRLWGKKMLPLGRVATKKGCFSHKCFFMLSGVCLR